MDFVYLRTLVFVLLVGLVLIVAQVCMWLLHAYVFTYVYVQTK